MRRRAAGILLHPTSLPSRFGNGDLGPAADRFLDWLEEAGQSVWQVLPLGPPAQNQSPYGSLSAFAGNAQLISPELLVEDGLLARTELADLPLTNPDRWEPSSSERLRWRLLRRAWETFREQTESPLREAFETFCRTEAQAGWLDEYALFVTLHEHLGSVGWWDWPAELAGRDESALEDARKRWADEIDFRRFVQFLFFRQWQRLHDEAGRRGIQLMGDLPIYVAHDSVDVWAHRELFDLHGDGRCRVVAGVPPDYFTEDGQLWGNPLYRWDALAERGFDWWVARIAAQLRTVDLLRLDHFRAFVAYWEVDAEAATARDGSWVSGPGAALFRALETSLGELPLIAEDLGVITDDVVALRRELGLPGMRVLQFGLGEIDGYHAPHRFEAGDVVYTGTHDNDTSRGWFESLSFGEKKAVLRYTGGRAATLHRDVIRIAYGSVADLAMVPLQDVLGLGSEARMNIPGQALGNWTWRLRPDALGHAAARSLRRRVEQTGRLPPPG